MPLHVGLFFGSFNPIHHGHLILSNFFLNQGAVDQVWFVVSPQNPLKSSSTLLNEYQRLHLVRIAIGDEPKFKVSDIEFRLPKPSYTIDTLTYLKEKYPENDYSVIIGSDSYQNLPKWKNYEQLLLNYRLLVYLRPGYPIEKYKNFPDPIVLKAPLLEISSSYIRNCIQKKQSIKYLLPDAVIEEIESNGYYRK